LWVPETAIKIGGFPILIVISGEDSSDWSANRISGLDMAAEGIIVITIQYRTNVFGWLSLDDEKSPGNLGLMDQLLAFEWIDENINRFGGDMNNVTLLGHGSMGAFNSFYHLLSPKTKRNSGTAAILLYFYFYFYLLFRHFFKSNSDVGQHFSSVSDQSRCFGRFRQIAHVRLNRHRHHAELLADEEL
jgi:hypothetical protein